MGDKTDLLRLLQDRFYSRPVMLYKYGGRNSLVDGINVLTAVVPEGNASSMFASNLRQEDEIGYQSSVLKGVVSLEPNYATHVVFF